MLTEKTHNPEIICSCFYNASFNLGKPDGPLKTVWGVKDLNFTGDIVKQMLEGTSFERKEVFNFNVNALNEIGVLNNMIDMAKG